MEFRSNVTINSQIADYVRKEIFSGRFPPNGKLPPIREFAVYCKVNPNTIVKVYQELSNEGLVYTDSTSGKFVTPNVSLIEEKKKQFLIDIGKSIVEEARQSGISKEEFTKLMEEIYND